MSKFEHCDSWATRSIPSARGGPLSSPVRWRVSSALQWHAVCKSGALPPGLQSCSPPALPPHVAAPAGRPATSARQPGETHQFVRCELVPVPTAKSVFASLNFSGFLLPFNPTYSSDGDFCIDTGKLYSSVFIFFNFFTFDGKWIL